MILLVDAGNSRIKWGVFEHGRWLVRDAVATAEADRLIDAWRGLGPSWIGISNVAGDATAAALRRALASLRLEPFWLRAEANRYGILNPYAQLGADRYAALVAARHRKLGHCLVASLGTALTADALTAGGEFLGGVIAPGYGLMRRSLMAGTAGVRAGEGAFAPFPATTEDAVETGILMALAGPIEGMRVRMQAALSGPVSLLLAGGDAARLQAVLDGPHQIAEDLVLEGLVWVAREQGVSDA